jgi:hypothetical protein
LIAPSRCSQKHASELAVVSLLGLRDLRLARRPVVISVAVITFIATPVFRPRGRSRPAADMIPKNGIVELPGIVRPGVNAPRDPWRCPRGCRTRYSGIVKEVLSYALGGVGVVMMAVAAAPAFAGNLRYLQAKLAVTNLLRTNPNHAEVMCRATKGTFLEALGAAMKTGAMIKSQDPKIVTSATQPSYDATSVQIKTRYKLLIGKVKLAAMAIAGGLGLGIAAGGVPVIVILLSIGAAALAVRLLVFKADVERSLILARAEILPEVDRAFVEGRYRFPPSTM